jgi:carbon-monoxide dehydrogenase medium subunit
VKPRPLSYVRATDLEHAVAVLAEAGDGARVLAGGQSLIPLLAMRRLAPTVLVDLGGMPELAYVHDVGDHVEIGAMTRTRDVELSSLVARMVPLLPEALRHVGSVAIRNRGTIGGSVAHADPAAEMPTALRALDGAVIATGPGGQRTIPAGEFFLGPQSTALLPGEVLTCLRVPKQEPGTGVAVEEFSRRHNHRAVLAVFAAVRLTSDNRVASAAVAVAGGGPTPIRAVEAELLLTGRHPGPELLAAAAGSVAAATRPLDDVHAPAQYRRHLAEVLARRCLETACSTVRNEPA